MFLEPSEALHCQLTGRQISKEEAIFLTASPDGVLMVDLNRDLPSEHACFECRRTILEEAVKNGVMQDFFGLNLKIPNDFVGSAYSLLKNKAINALCLARKSGILIAGFEKVLSALKAGEAEFLVRAVDDAEGRKQKNALNAGNLRIFSVLNAQELGGVFGRERIVHTAVLKGNISMSSCVLSLIAKVQNFQEIIRIIE